MSHSQIMFSDTTNVEKQLIRELLKDYEVFVRPVRNFNDAVGVKVDIIPILLTGLVNYIQWLY